MSAFPSSSLISSFLGLITTGTPYLALYTSNPTADDTGTEVTGGLYAREAITFTSTLANEIHNGSSITFTGVPAGTITHWGIRSAASAGTLRAFGPLSSPVVAETGDNVIFDVDDIHIAFAGS